MSEVEEINLLVRFLREFVRNSCDAMDMVKFERVLPDKSNRDGQPEELFIGLVPDKAKGTLSIIDNGVGMTRDDLVKNLTRMARSRTKRYAEALQAGQIGVAFYSAHRLADKVIVTTKRNADEQYVCKSGAAGGSFDVTKDVDGEQLGRGTKITLYLKDHLEYLEESRMRDLVKKHFEFISYPIYLWTAENEICDDDDQVEEPNKEEEEGDVEQVNKEKEGGAYKNKNKNKIKVSHGWELIHKPKPTRLRMPEEIIKEESMMAGSLRYHSTKSGEEVTSLKDRVTRMKQGQRDIDYIKNSPFLDAIIGYVVGQVKEYDGKKLVSATNQEALNFEDETEEELHKKEVKKKSFEELCKTIKDILGDKVGKVVVSDRRMDSPCCLVTGARYGLESIIEKTLEIDPDNDIMEELRKMADADKNDKLVMDIVLLIFDRTLLNSGFSLDDPSTFDSRMNNMLKHVSVLVRKRELKIQQRSLLSFMEAKLAELRRAREGTDQRYPAPEMPTIWFDRTDTL